MKSVAPGSPQRCTSAHIRLASLHLGASRVAQRRCVAALGRPAACIASRLVQLKATLAPGSAQSCTAAHSRIASLHLGESRLAQLAAASRPLASRYVQRIAPSLARSCMSAHSRLASLHLEASRVAQLAAASRPLAVPLRAERRAWFSSKLHGGPQPPRVTPHQGVACRPASRCAAAFGRRAAGMA